MQPNLSLRPLSAAGLVLAVSTLAACGGGGGSTSAAPPPPDAAAAAATSTAQNNAECVAIRPFYWEIGNASGVVVSGAQGSTYNADSVVSIASASKWLYASYVVQKRNGVLSNEDIRYLHFYSGYTTFAGCAAGDSVASCLNDPGTGPGTTNGTLVTANIDKFYYGGGHLQKHASLDATLAGLGNAGLAAEVAAGLGGNLTLAYSEPQLAGGARMSAAEYGKFLRRVLAGNLLMRNALGSHAVCTNMRQCPNSLNSPSPPGEQWNYSMGHWVEDTTNVSDGAFSSPGAFGFYPWIDKTKTLYGIVARRDDSGALDSMACGRLIRRAYVTATAQ